MPIAIEQDLVWRPATASTPAHSIVSHGEPFTGEEPTLRDFFERIRPIATQALASATREHWPLITLNLDFKDSHPQHLAEIRDLLGAYEGWLTTAARVDIVERVQPSKNTRRVHPAEFFPLRLRRVGFLRWPQRYGGTR